MKFFESEDEKEMKQADGEKPADAPKADHSDEEQDKELFAQLIKQYLGKEEPDAMECEMAKQAYQAHKEKGMEDEAAMEAAGKHLQMAAEIGKKMHQAMEAKEEKTESEEKTEDECGDKKEAENEKMESEDEKKEASQQAPDKMNPGKKEAAAVAKLSGEVAKLRESLKQYEMKDYLESKLKKSGETNTCTKLFREALGKPRSKQHIDETWSTFIKAYKAGAEEVGSDDVLLMEKQSYRSRGTQKGSFSDCLE